MKRSIKVFVAIGGVFFATLAAEKVFLSRLEYSVIHDDARLDAFLKSLHYPISIEPGEGFCRAGGSSWVYTYQLCLSSRGNPIGCAPGSLTLEYLGPQGKISIISNDYHDTETPFRFAILNIDRDGSISSTTALEN